MKITADDFRKVIKDRSSYYLIAMNSFPILGVLLWEWDPVAMVYIYVAETIVIGLFNFVKILMSRASVQDKAGKKLKIPFIANLLIGIFFFIHYNAFNYGQIELFTSFAGRSSSPIGSFFGYFFSDTVLTNALLIIIVVHSLTFFTDFIRGKQYEYIPSVIFLFLPYPRIFVQQFVGVFGAFFVLIFNLPMMFLILLQVLKTITELFSNKLINEKLERAINSFENDREQELGKGRILIKKKPSSLFSLIKRDE